MAKPKVTSTAEVMGALLRKAREKRRRQTEAVVSRLWGELVAKAAADADRLEGKGKGEPDRER